MKKNEQLRQIQEEINAMVKKMQEYNIEPFLIGYKKKIKERRKDMDILEVVPTAIKTAKG